MNKYNTLLKMLVPLSVTLLLTIIMYYSKGFISIKHSESDDSIIYKTIGVDIISYKNSAYIEETEELVGVYNLDAGNIDNWQNKDIVYEEYELYKDDFIYVNGEIASSEDFETYLVYEFDNEKQLKVLKEDIGDREYSNYSYETTEANRIISETFDDTNNTIKRLYNNNVIKIYQLSKVVKSTDDSIKIAKINIFNIFITYLILLALQLIILAILNRRRHTYETKVKEE